MKILSKFTVIALACSTFATPAVAQDTARVTVRYGDLDLRSAQGAADLSRRIRSAGRLICGEPASRSLFERGAVNSCLEQVAASASGARASAIAEARSSQRPQNARAETGSRVAS